MVHPERTAHRLTFIISQIVDPLPNHLHRSNFTLHNPVGNFELFPGCDLGIRNHGFGIQPEACDQNSVQLRLFLRHDYITGWQVGHGRAHVQ